MFPDRTLSSDCPRTGKPYAVRHRDGDHRPTRPAKAPTKLTQRCEGCRVPQVSLFLRDLGTNPPSNSSPDVSKLRTKPSFNACMTVEIVSRFGSLTSK